jgi:hypothetical protein
MPTYLGGWGAVAAATLALPAFRAAPITAKYRVDQSLTQEVDASAEGQGKQTLRFSTSAFVTVTLNDSAGGRTMKVVIDSVKGDSAAPIPPAVMDSARGGEFRAFVSKAGKPSPLTPTGTSPAAAQVQGLLVDFYPWVRPGLKVGDTWTDTTVNTTGAGSDTVTVRRITSYKGAATESRGKIRALRITTEHDSDVAGVQPTPQGPATIEGTGGGTGAYYVSTDGRYLGGEWQMHSTLNLSGTFVKQPVPVTVTQNIKVTAVR